MALSTTPLGSNSADIAYDAATALADLIQEIEDYIVLHGWDLYDVSAGTNARAYRAANKDAASYKYIVLDYNTSGYLFIKTYESWNSTTHVGTNLCYRSDLASQTQRVDLTNGGNMYVYAHARWLVMQSEIPAGIGSSTGNAWCGCFEVTRDNEDDTAGAGYPPLLWVNGNLMFTGTWYVSAFPRTRSGDVGQEASQRNITTHILGFGGVASESSSAGQALSLTVPTTLIAWNSKNWSLTLRAGNIHTANELRGRIYGLKLTTANQGTLNDEIEIDIDADFFNDPVGTPATHRILFESVSNGRWGIPE